MTDEKKVEVMNPQPISTLPIDERLIKAFEQIAEKTYLMIQKRDYRATLVHREEKGEIPDSAAALIHINEEDYRDENDNPTELDFKGNITSREAYLFQNVNYAQALARLKDWAYFEEPKFDRVGNPIVDEHGNQLFERIPINLAQIDMLSKKRLNLGIMGHQANQHIRERRANAGMPEDTQSLGSRIAGWTGFKKERISKEEIEAQYGKQKQ